MGIYAVAQGFLSDKKPPVLAEGGKMRRKDDTLRDTLLNLSRQIADAEGIDAVNIRSIAKKAGVATGTVYNYFASKDEILLALTEEYWKQTLHDMKDAIAADSFCEQLREIFTFLKRRIEQSAGKLMNSLGNVETVGQARMLSMQSALEAALVWRMEQDTGVRKDIWGEAFTKEQFARFIMMNMMVLLKEEVPDIDFFLTVVKRILY